MKSIFVIVLILLSDGAPIEGHVGGPYETRAECEAKKKEAETRAKEKGAEAVMVCTEVKLPPKNTPKLKTERLS